MIENRPFGRILWDAGEAAPDLLVSPGLAEELAVLRAGLPVAASITPFDTGAAVRPYRHMRAFYIRRGDHVLAVKGSEPHARDLVPTLQGMSGFRIEFPGRGRSLFSALEHFPLNEQKLPLAMSAEEALEDVRSAAMVQQAHIARFGEPARLPLPLLAVRWNDDLTQAHLETLRPLLSGRAWRTVQRIGADGLGAVVYHYPGLPLRVAHLPEILRPEILHSADGAGWLDRLGGLCDPAATVERWVDLVARMLVLGFLPGSIESIGVGHCLEMKNAVIDGGFVDMGSVCRVADVTDPRAFLETLLAALADLAKTTRQFLMGDAPEADAEYRNPSLAMVLMLHRLLPKLAARVTALGGADPRITAFFDNSTGFGGLGRDGMTLASSPIHAGGHR
jgi:hypothetical protein